MISHSDYAQDTLEVSTKGRGMLDITHNVMQCVVNSAISTGMCHIFLRHTSASLILCENADPDVRVDLETFMLKTVPDGDSMFIHTAEGPDDMPAHVRSILTQSELTLPIRCNRLDLGTWQGIYLWEHRTSAHRRSLTVTMHGKVD